MKRSVLIVLVAAGLIGLAGSLRRSAGPAPSAAPDVPLAAAPDATPALPAPPPSPERIPQLASYRVFEDVVPGGLHVRGVGYHAAVDSRGLSFEARDARINLKGAGLDQGGVPVPLKDAPAERARFAVARADRGAMIEEYVFENSRVEQLFRIPAPVGEGALTVRVAVDSTLEGAPELRPANHGVLLGRTADGTPVTYDGALAIDAAGRREPIQPRLEGGEIVLTVSADFMAKATYPVVVDPWLQLDFSAERGGLSATAAVSQTPSIAIEGGGNPYVVWSEEVTVGTAKNFEVYLRYWNGFQWFDLGGSSTGNGLSNTPGDSTNPTVALTTSGEVFVAWQDNTDGNFEIYLKRWTGTNWVEVSGSASLGGVSRSTGESYFPSVAFMTTIIPSTQEFQTVPVVAWQDTTTGPTQIHIAAFFPGDSGLPDDTNTGQYEYFPPILAKWYALGSVQAPANVAISGTPTGYVSERPRLVMTETGVGQGRLARIVWQDTRDDNYEVYYADGLLADDPTSFNSTPPTTDPMTGAVTPAPDPNKNPPPPGRQNPIWARTAIAWALTNVSNTLTLSSNPSLAVNDGGNIWIVWEEGTSLTDSEIHASLNLGASVVVSDNTLPSPHRSTTPVVAVSPGNGGFAYLAWVDDEPGNTEIYVKRTPVTTNTNVSWVSVGFDPSFGQSTPGLGGISRTFSASLFPAIRAGQNVVVAWQDLSNGGFDVYLRRFYENEPRQLRQTTPSAASVIPFGGNTFTETVELRAIVFSEDNNRAVRLEVEVRPVTSAFTGRAWLEGELIAVDLFTHEGLSEAVIPFRGAVNTSYHWRARTIDDIGRRSAWISAGSNLDGEVDFRVSAIPPQPPEPPTNLLAGADGLTVNLTWTPPPGGQTLTYNVYRQLTSPIAEPPAGAPIATGVAATKYTDASGLAANTTYYYVVKAVDNAGQVSLNSNEASATTPAPPNQVTGVAATPSANQIALSWTIDVNATSYTVQRRGPMPTTAPFTTIAAGVTTNTYTDTGLPNNATFEYQVIAVNSAGPGPASATASATTPPPSPPPPPTALAAFGDVGEVDLTWTPPGGGPYTFNVRRATSAGGPYTVIATGLSTSSFSDTTVVALTSYFFVVTANNGFGESAFSNEVSAAATAPGGPPTAPQGLLATGGTNSIALTWSPPSSAGAVSYALRRASSAGGPYTVIATGLTSTSYNDTGLPAQMTFFYVATATNGAGESPFSNEASAMTAGTPAAPTPPSAPQFLTAAAATAAVDLNWTAPVSGNPVVYNIRRGTASGGPYTVLATSVSGTAFTDTTVVLGTTYFYRATAVNSLGESAQSNEASAASTTASGPPPAPTNLAATAGAGSITLNWTASPGGASYNVRRSTSPGGPYSVIATGLTAATYLDGGLPSPATFFYVVTAVNGLGESAFSNEGSASTTTGGPPPPSSAPTAPTNLNAAAGAGQIVLTWTTSLGTPPFTYNVHRSNVTGGPYAVVATGVTTTTYTDSAVTVGTAHFYRVVGVNGFGASGFSNEATATATAAAGPPPPPTNLTATLVAGNTQLNWAAPVGAGSVVYNVKRGTAAGGPYTTIAAAVAVTSYTDTATPAGRVFYVVTAQNGQGESINSNEVQAGTALVAGFNAATDSKDKCGLLGVEVLGLLALGLLRRRSRKA